MGVIALVLLVAAVALLVATEWPWIGSRVGLDARRRRERTRRRKPADDRRARRQALIAVSGR
jgi:hypothetical protein